MKLCMKKVCKYCQDEFEGNKIKIFCSDRCRTYHFREKNNIPINPFATKKESFLEKMQKAFKK